jgi:hypothetical protein
MRGTVTSGGAVWISLCSAPSSVRTRCSSASIPSFCTHIGATISHLSLHVVTLANERSSAWDDEVPGPRPSSHSQEHSQSRASSLPPSSPLQQQSLANTSHAWSSSRASVSSAHLGGCLHTPQSPQSSTPHRNASMSSPPTPSRNASGRKPKPSGPDHRHAPVSRQRRLMALQSALGEVGLSTPSKSSSEPSTPARSARVISPRPGPSQPKSGPEAIALSASLPIPSVEIKPAQAELVSPLPSPEIDPVLSPRVDSSVVADPVDSEDEYWATTTLRAPLTVAAVNAFTEADCLPAPAAPRPSLTPQESNIVVITTDMEMEVEDCQHSSSSRTRIVTPTASSSPTRKSATADKGKGRAISPFSDSDDDFSFSSDESELYSTPPKRPFVSTTFPLSDSDDDYVPASPLKRHRALGPLPTPPASSPVLRLLNLEDDDNNDNDLDLPIPGAFDFESERSRSVSPSSERGAKEDSKRSVRGASPMKGVRFVLVCVNLTMEWGHSTHALYSRQATARFILICPARQEPAHLPGRGLILGRRTWPQPTSLANSPVARRSVRKSSRAMLES